MIFILFTHQSGIYRYIEFKLNIAEYILKGA